MLRPRARAPFDTLGHSVLYCTLVWAVSSGWLEHLPFKQGVAGSNPARLMYYPSAVLPSQQVIYLRQHLRR